MGFRDPRSARTRARIPAWGTLLAAGLLGYSLSLVVRAGRWPAVAVLIVVLVIGATVLVALWDGIRRLVDAFVMLGQDPEAGSLYGRVHQAETIAQHGDVAAAVEILDAVAAAPAMTRAPLLVGAFAMVRGAIAEAQGDLERAEHEMQIAVAVHEQRWDRAAHSEALEKLGKIQLIRGSNADAYRTLTEAVRVGGGRMYRLSRVRTELFRTVIALNDDDAVRMADHMMTARELAIRWRCHAQHGIACDMLARWALHEGRIDDAKRFVTEATDAYRRGNATLPHRLRHFVALAKLAEAHGDHHEALRWYLRTMHEVADLRGGWGWRNAQAYFVDIYSEDEVSAFECAYALHLRGDVAATDGFATLLDLGNRTALRQMLRGELLVDEPDDLGEASLQGIVEVLAAIATREGTVSEALTLGMQEESPQAATVAAAGRQDVAACHERLEGLVSLRFRRSMQGRTAASPTDAGPWAVRWQTHVLQTRLLIDGDTMHVAGLWTTPDGVRRPFLHPVDARQARLIGEVAGLADLSVGPDPEAEPRRDPGSDEESPSTVGAAEGVRADAPGWRKTPRFHHLRNGDSVAWTDLAGLLLPADLVALLAQQDPGGEVPRLLLIPDSILWRVPWAAVKVEPGHAEGYLADRAVLAMLPSLSLVEDPPEPATTPTPPPAAPVRALAYLAGVHREGLTIERAALDAAYGADIEYAIQPTTFLNALDPASAPLALAVVSVHGNSRPGLAHALKLDRHTVLSAARMLTLRFPQLLMINACLSAELDERHGTDPLGIPTAALCRGAETVIGGIFPLPDGPTANPVYSHPTAGILAILYRLLADGVPPSSALRAAQRRWRRERGPVPPWLWAGLISITTQFTDVYQSISDEQEQRSVA
ncbi:CHAT domain-containing protein [Micromonospora sp. U21]|uniref:CHAT domain-containing protein n=1 Tax=Micromonospora sp. U21 TaxID=2824899 RepID=UPI001B38DAB8|nr:CHAT domain-containing protein [Micromonospora sp. U21]MBQ0906139.1 CHAT domain-containing protein [Micromonospora sp. U21]